MIGLCIQANTVAGDIYHTPPYGGVIRLCRHNQLTKEETSHQITDSINSTNLP